MTTPLSTILQDHMDLSYGERAIVDRELTWLFGVARDQDQVFSRKGSVINDPASGIILIDPETGKVTVALQSDGDAYFGSDLDFPANTALGIFSQAQTYNEEAIGAGDLLIGDNSSGKANMLWDVSAGQLKFRGGTTVNTYIDVDGTIHATSGVFSGTITATLGAIGGWSISSTTLYSGTDIVLTSQPSASIAVADGDVILDDTGITVVATTVGSEQTKQLKFWYDKPTVQPLGTIDAYYSGASDHLFTIKSYEVNSRTTDIIIDSIGAVRIQGDFAAPTDEIKIRDFADFFIEDADVEIVDGTLYFTAARDAYVFRNAADEVGVHDHFHADSDVKAGRQFLSETTGTTGGFFCADVLWYRSAANVWRTPDSLVIDGGLDVGGTSPATGWIKAANGIRMYGDGATYGITAGASSDVQWYRNAANVWRTPDSVQVDGDIYTATWADYSASSTIVGWSSYTTKVIYYKKVGNMVFVQFRIAGTSNSAITTFTLPYSMASGVTLNTPWGLGRDNGSGLTTPGRIYIASGNTAQCYKDMFTGTWTASGTKEVRGQFFYEAA